MDPINTGSATADVSQLNTPAPETNVGSPAPAPASQTPETMSLAELNSLLGREFKSKDSALKSIQDTYKFATTRIADVEKTFAEKSTQEYKKLAEGFEAQQREMFFLQNPQFAPHRKLIESLGKTPSEVVNSDIFKETFSKLSEHDKTVKLKTVLESNPRLAASNDGFKKAVELKTQHGKVTSDVEKLVTDAVIDAYGLRG